MDDHDDQETQPTDFNKLDLSQLENFSFGTQWSQEKAPPADSREPRGRPRREERSGQAGEPRRDRRRFSKPAARDTGAPQGAPADRESRPPRDFRVDARRRSQPGRGREEYRPEPHVPYDSPYFAVSFYPEDNSFNTVVKVIRASCRTMELFEIARQVVDKNDRFIAVISRKPSADGSPVEPVYLAVPDGLPFASEADAVSHVCAKYLDQFLDVREAEVEPPKGNFQVINRCGVTGELLGPPNYHRYNQMVERHYAEKIKRMSPEAFRARIETVRDPEVVAQWLEKMKKVTRYTWKTEPAPAKAEAAAPIAAPAAETIAEAAGEAPEAEPVAPAPVTPDQSPATPAAASTPAEAPAAEAPSFDSLEEARAHLLKEARGRVVRAVTTARMHGRLLDTLPDGEIRRAVIGALERQRHFPLDTANGLRGRLRREHFTIFKKGPKGVSFVCAVKRKFRTPGQVFAESIGALLACIEANPMIKRSELPGKLLGFMPAEAAPVTAASTAAPEGEPAAAAPTEANPPPATGLTAEQQQQLTRLHGDLRWLVTEGYVTEFLSGGLYAAPPLPAPRAGRESVNAGDETAEEEAEGADAATAGAFEAESADPAQPPPPTAGGHEEEPPAYLD